MGNIGMFLQDLVDSIIQWLEMLVITVGPIDPPDFF